MWSGLGKMNPLNHHLENAGYRVSPNAKGRYIQGLIRLVGELSAMDFLHDDYMIRLLSNAQLRKGKAFTYKQLQQLAIPESDIDRFYTQMQTLSAKGLFLRGYSLQCPVCDLETWYDLSSVGEHVICQGCRFSFQMPLTLPFAYRPNRLLIEALKSGALTILLTALWLSEQDNSMQWQTESVVHQGNIMTDIDILATVNKELWLIECKDNFKVTDKALDDIIEQLRVGQKIKDDLGAEQSFFATLYAKSLPERLVSFLYEQNIQVLTRRDLLRVR